MKSKWPTKKLGEVVKLRMGETLIKKDLTGDGAPVYSADSLRKPWGFTSKNKLQFGQGTIIVGARGTIGSLKLPSDEKFTSTQTTIAIEPDKNQVASAFLFYFLNILNFKGFVAGTGIPMITVGYLNRIRIPMPSLKIQKQIVTRVERLFGKIDKAIALREKAIKNTSQIFPSTLHQIFSKNKWPKKKLEEICMINPSKTELKNVPDNLEVSFVPMSAVDEVSGSIITQEKKLLGKVKKGYTYFKEGDVLFAKITPCMENGKSVIAKNLTNKIGFGSTEFHVLRPTKAILSQWAHLYVRQPWFRKEAKKHFTGTAGQQRVPREFLEKTKIPLPPLSEQKKIVAKLDKLKQKVDKLKILQQNQLQDLTELKQSILAKAFKGELVK